MSISLLDYHKPHAERTKDKKEREKREIAKGGEEAFFTQPTYINKRIGNINYKIIKDITYNMPLLMIGQPWDPKQMDLRSRSIRHSINKDLDNRV